MLRAVEAYQRYEEKVGDVRESNSKLRVGRLGN